MITMEGKYQTRDGRAVRILAVDLKCPTPVVGFIEGESVTQEWMNTGVVMVTHNTDDDLLPVPTKHEGWISINTDYSLWSSKEECLKNELHDHPMPEGIVIAHVTWED